MSETVEYKMTTEIAVELLCPWCRYEVEANASFDDYTNSLIVRGYEGHFCDDMIDAVKEKLEEDNA